MADHAAGLDLLGVSVDDPSERDLALKVASRVHYPTAMQADVTMSGLSRTWAIPMNYLMAQDGRVVLDGKPGFKPGDGPELEKRIQLLLTAPAL